MRLIDEKLLASLRLPGRCECCKRWCQKREPHHLLSRGAGGAMRIDHPWNLLALGSSETFWLCGCHGLIHSGVIRRDDLYDAVSIREWVTVTEIKAYVHWLQHQSKEDRRRDGIVMPVEAKEPSP